MIKRARSQLSNARDPRVFWFDLGNVLLPFDFTGARRLLAARAGTTPEEIRRFFRQNRWIETQSDTGRLTAFGLYRLLRSRFDLKNLSYKAFGAIWNRIFTVDRGVLAILRRLKKKGCRLILISNTNRLHYDYIERVYPFMALFDHVVLSYELRTRKPERAIYRRAFRLSRTARQNIFYTDDKAEFIRAARAHFGVSAHLFRGAKGLKKAIVRWGVSL